MTNLTFASGPQNTRIAKATSGRREAISTAWQFRRRAPGRTTEGEVVQGVIVVSEKAPSSQVRPRFTSSADLELRDLCDVVRKEGPLAPERAVRVVRRAAREMSAPGRRGNAGTLVFSLGVALFFALTGKAPFEAELGGAGSPPSPSAFSPHRVDPRLDAIVRTCLAKQPSDRFSSSMELSAALSALSFDDMAAAA